MDLAIQFTPQTAVEKSIELLVKRNGDEKHCSRTTATFNAIGRTGQATGFTFTKERNKIQDKRQRRMRMVNGSVFYKRTVLLERLIGY